MKIKKENYREVERLPSNAMKVSKYAENKGVVREHIYTHFRRGKADYEIILFADTLWVIKKK